VTEHISHAELVNLLTAIFSKHRCRDEVARMLAENMATAEGDGALSHGIFRIAGNLASLDTGWVDGMAIPEVEDTAPGMVRADGHNGFALPAFAAARDLFTAKARANGIAVMSVRNSHHFGALWPDVEPFARDGFVALAMVNSMASVVHYGGHSKVFGTNPLAFAAPRGSSDPLVFDLAAAALSNGDVQLAAREGRQLDPGMGVDRHGHPTTDPNAVLDGGALNAFGGHKGAALALMMEVMSAGLSGGNFSFEVDWSDHPGAATPRSGETLILIDPRRGASRDFTARIEQLVEAIRAAGGERLPGERRYAIRREAARLGVALEEQELAELRRLAGQ